MLPSPPTVSPGPLPVLMTYSVLKSGENRIPFGSWTWSSLTTMLSVPFGKVEGVAVAVVGRHEEDAHMAIIFQQAQLSVVGDVAPQQVALLAAAGRPFCPQDRLAVHVAVP